MTTFHDIFTPNQAMLAPLAGVADRAMRELCMEFGAAACCSEMVSAMGIYCGDRKSEQLMALSQAEMPAGIQLFGKEPHTFPKAAEAALRHNPVFIDINMGCPAQKVAGGGSGAALMKTPQLAQEIIQTVIKEVNNAVPVSVKIRTGWDEHSVNCIEVAKLCEAAGASWITVHGRNRRQMYAPPVDYDAIKAVKQAVNIPVVANGDVTNGPSAKHMLDATGCDAVMVGRGAMGAPWVFEHIAAYLKDGTLLPELTPQQRMEVMLRHVKLLCDYKGERHGMREARKHAAWYLKGMRDGAKLRQQAVNITRYEELEAIAAALLA